MKIIFSRKGFDSGAGGVPSPIFPDGQLLSLPIPDKSSKLAYKSLSGNSWATIGELIGDLKAHKPDHRELKPSDGAHLDPDLERDRLPRAQGWRPLFGQVDSAQGHLENHGVSRGDVFLFFGLFRPVQYVGGSWRFRRNERAKHVIWGWLQINEMIDLALQRRRAAWALYHPHFSLKPRRKNVLYVAERILELPGLHKLEFPGAGIFPRFVSELQLTAPDSERVSCWLLKKWFHPHERKSVLTYHKNPSRWGSDPRGTILSTVGRGQEFVLDCEHYPEAVDWLANLVELYSPRIAIR